MRRVERIEGAASASGRSGQTLWVLCAAVAHLGGCALWGPGVTQTSHLAYNEAVQTSAQQEILLNLVRLRYTDAPEFLAISSISAQMSFDAGASIGGDFGRVESAGSAFVSPGASVGYSERPTVSFAPERGAEFTRQLVAPIELDSLYLLSQYGWDMDRVLRVTTNDLNGMRNVVSREGRKAAVASSLRSFARMAALIGRLHDRSGLKIAAVERQTAISAPLPVDSVSADDLVAAAKAGFRYVYRDDPPAYVLSESRKHYVLDVSNAAPQSAELGELAHLLGLEAGLSVYEVDRAGALPQAKDTRTVRIETRSVLGVLAYLSQAVQVPAAHVERGLVTRDPVMEEVFSDLLKIRVADEAPDGTTFAVPYRGYWFYIDERDVSSKRTMGLLTSILRLEISTGGAQNVPILTLPVSR